MVHAFTVFTCQYKSTVFRYLVSLLQQKLVSGIQGLVSYLSLLLGSSLFHKSCFPDIPLPASMLQGVSCDMLLCLLPQVLGPAECLFLCSCTACLFTHLGWHQESPNLTSSLYLMQLWLAKLPTGLLVASFQLSDFRPVPDCFGFIAQC